MDKKDKVCICCTNLEKQKKFIWYWFPKNVDSLYAKDFCNKHKWFVGGKPEAFSNEWEWGKLTSSANFPLGVTPKNIVDEE